MSDFEDVDAHEQQEDQYFQPGDQAIPEQGDAADQYIGQSRTGIAAPHVAMRNMAARVLAYLHGEGAAAPAQVQQLAQQVDPDQTMTPDQRTAASIKAAGQSGGMDAAWATLQAHRQMYNAKTSFAQAALTGSGGKPPDLPAAVAAANEAYTHMPDGNSLFFQPNVGGGVTATVTGKNGKQSFMLAPDQFKQWLDVGGVGQFDNVHDHGGAAAILAKLASKNRAAPAAPAQQESDEDERPGAFSDELEARSRRIFPWASQERQRQMWLNQQETAQTERQNKVDIAKAGFDSKLAVARETGRSRENVATTNAGARVQAGQTRAQNQKEMNDARIRSNEQMGRERNATRLIAGQQFNEAATPLSPEAQQQRLQIQRAGQPGARVNTGEPAKGGKVKMKLPDGRIVYVQG